MENICPCTKQMIKNYLYNITNKTSKLEKESYNLLYKSSHMIYDKDSEWISLINEINNLSNIIDNITYDIKSIDEEFKINQNNQNLIENDNELDEEYIKYEDAIEKVKNGCFFTSLDVLRLADKNGNSIAHEQARLKWVSQYPEILRIKNLKGWSVAHEQAYHGWKTDDPQILNMKCRGISVKQIIQDYLDFLKLREESY